MNFIFRSFASTPGFIYLGGYTSANKYTPKGISVNVGGVDPVLVIARFNRLITKVWDSERAADRAKRVFAPDAYEANHADL
ncbi:hypothetical protein [Mycobacterium sp. 852013-50091_SCH5140682]|uniref:hypothetical protein n=1 Tax=Mycobacterium sp. 852013-50091_SCH5140682 TaxID=1834109 RepID=UPI0012EAF387|nr:hypothetical protein [Mycobacterium sp. 852013-50091_SCH5140682]